MDIKREKLTIKFIFKDEEEQEYWEETFINLAKYEDGEYKNDMAKGGYIDEETIKHKKELDNLEKFKHNYIMGRDGCNKLMKLKNIK